MIAVIIGTRPEAIKLWPVVLELRKRKHAVTVISTGQQAHLLEPIMEELGLKADISWAPGSPLSCWPGPAAFLGRAIEQLALVLGNASLVLVQGDTMTALAGALAAYYGQVPVMHVEAGLRTQDITNPFPEEGNRQMIARIAEMHFAPTKYAKWLLVSEAQDDCDIVVTGNTVVDALRMISQLPAPSLPPPAEILVTFHRRESWDLAGHVADMINDLGQSFNVRWYLHANPFLAERIRARAQVVDVQPASSYRRFIAELSRAGCVITDSGGVIEEASILGKPLVILREETERPEALEFGKLLAPSCTSYELEMAVRAVLKQPVKPSDAFGDGEAAVRIVDAVEAWLTR